jgi:ribosomal-protein-alanine N-acetyltransferase
LKNLFCERPEMSTALPHLFTPRLVLRPLQQDQAETLCALANDPKIADNTVNMMPSPYTLETAQTFIGGMEEKYRSGQLLGLGIHLRETSELAGVISLRLSAAHRSGHLGYWVAAHCRNQGFAAEAATAVMGFGFTELQLHRIGSQCFSRNQESARVMEKIGLRHEGCMQGAFLKSGVHEDLLLYGLVHDDWQGAGVRT